MQSICFLSVLATALFLLIACDPSADAINAKASQARKAPQACKVSQARKAIL